MWSHRRRIVVGVLAAVLVLGCGAVDDGEPGAEPAPGGTEGPEEVDGFDPERSREQAEGYLGRAEEDVEETVMVRILRRGDEQFAGTMDLRPGRLNLELDPGDDGVYRVTRVVVETEDGEDLVVE